MSHPDYQCWNHIWIEYQLIILMAENQLNTKYSNLLKYRLVPKSPNAFILASVVSGFTWYFLNQQTKHFDNHQQELISRVERGETADNFKVQFDRFKVNDWDCKKVNVDGVLKKGRFFIKRNRGKQEGYLVLAPFVVETQNPLIYPNENYEVFNQNRKFILNLGWIPKSRKHLVYTTVPESVIGQETYTERQQALAKENADGLIRDPLKPSISVPVTNVTAYIRKAEPEDQLNGRTNFKDNFLYKWINLQELTRVFRVSNEEQGETIYLEKTIKTDDEPETIPIAATKQTVITDLHTESKNFKNNANRFFWMTTGLSFGVASWITFL